MESLFLNQVLKAMRSAIPKADEDKEVGLGGGLGKDIYTQMFDQELAGKMAGVSDRSIATSIYNSMVHVLETRYGSGQTQNSLDQSVIPQTRYIEVKANDTVESEPAGPVKKNNSKIDQTGYDSLIEKISQKYKIDPDLIKSVVMTESGGDPKAVSHAGAKGLMQLTDTTAAEMGVEDVFDPEQNIEGGTKYIRQMIDRFGNIEDALAAYNAGPSRVEKYGGIPPFPETQNYVRMVIDTVGSKQKYYE